MDVLLRDIGPNLKYCDNNACKSGQRDEKTYHGQHMPAARLSRDWRVVRTSVCAPITRETVAYQSSYADKPLLVEAIRGSFSSVVVLVFCYFELS